MKQPTKPLTVRWEGPALHQLAALLRTFNPPVHGTAPGEESDPRPAASVAARAGSPAALNIADTAPADVAGRLQAEDPPSGANTPGGHTFMRGRVGTGRTFFLAAQDSTPLPDPVPATEPIGILDPHED